MTRPNDIPQDVWDAAIDVLSAVNGPPVDMEGEEDAYRIARAILAERDRCLLRVAEQRCERGTPWDLAIVAAMNAIKPGSAVFVSPADQASREASSSPASLDAPKPGNENFARIRHMGPVE